MEVFHLVIDTSMLRKLPFQHPDFLELVDLSRAGKLRIYIPQIALEEQRTHHLELHAATVEQVRVGLAKLRKGMLGVLVEGLPEARLDIWSLADVDRNSREAISRFLEHGRIEVVPITLEHAVNAWVRFFETRPPFKAGEERSNRRKDIPDAWILEAGLGVKGKAGRHCALVDDTKLANAFSGEGFHIYRDKEISKLVSDVEQGTAVIPLAEAPRANVSLDRLRSPEFEHLDLVVLGMIGALNAPSKQELFETLEYAGFSRALVEHEARTLELSGRLMDAGAHYIPTDRDLALKASESVAVVEALLRISK